MKTLFVIASMIGLSLCPSWVEAARQQQTVPTTINCDAPLSYGAPTVPGKIQRVCHTNYTSFYDTDLKIPRLVVYHLTGDHSFGCLPRKASFHGDEQLPAEARQNPGAYLSTGYDLGHMAPDQDMAWDLEALGDSYSTANVAPQKPGMNRQGWEALEEDVRAWAMERGDELIYVGSIVEPHSSMMNGVTVPRAFFKITIDPKTKETIGFIMNNVDTPKGDMTPYINTIAKIEEQSGIAFPMPEGTDKAKTVALWHTSTSDWRKKHKEICKGK